MKAADKMHIVIQGAGRGIGLALAQHALKAGATNLYLTARAPETSDGYTLLPPSDRISWFAMDFLDTDSIAQTGAAISNAAPHLHRVISTAGILHDTDIQPEKHIGALNPAAMLRLYQVNAMGPALFWQALWRRLRSSAGGEVASISARVGSISDNHLGGWYSYRASKSALNQLSRTMSIELARYNPAACVITLHPGTVDTALSKPFQAKLGQNQLTHVDEAAANLWAVMDKTGADDTGGFFAYDGSPIPF